MDRLIIKMPLTYQEEKKYICDVVFRQFLGIQFTIEWLQTDTSEYCIEYSNSSISLPEILFSIPLDQWLSDVTFPTIPLEYVHIGDCIPLGKIPVLFGTYKPGEKRSPLDIDFLGSMFFLLTRYEEVNSTKKDIFGRYHHEASLLYRENLLRRPLVNEYLEILKREIKKIAPSITFKKHRYELSLSHDVDVPMTLHLPIDDYVRKSIGDLFFRRSPQLLFKRAAGKVRHMIKRTFQWDPNNTFDFLMNAEDNAGVKSIFNFIPVMGPSEFDSHYDINHPFIQSLLRIISEREFEIGFHPSFHSFGDIDRTKQELDRLNTALDDLGMSPVKKGRQHYLRWTNPVTWRIWAELGLEEDSSLGYGMINGFRSGCAFKYTVFDLLDRKHLNLIEEPLIVMDVNSDVNSKPATVLAEISHFSDTCRFFDGNFTVLYHNNYVITKQQQQIYSEILRLSR